MSSMRQWALLAATGLLAGSCQILAYTWTVPAAVAPGRVFTMRVAGQTDTTFGRAGVVFQVPNGFTVLGASATASSALAGAPVRDTPALIAAYTPDPGHYLASFDSTSAGGGGSTIAGELTVYVQAPQAPGAYQLEMALAATTGSPPGPFTPQLGLSSFQVPGGSVVRPIQVGPAPAPPPFALTTVLFGAPGLPNDTLEIETADIDRDGHSDLVSVTSQDVAVRRSIPGGFAPATVLPVGGGNLFDCALADFDGDGFVDIALSTGTVLFGDGGTTWAPVVAVSVVSARVGAGDVDGDGLADLAWSDGPSFGVVRGQANRTFLPWNTGLTLPTPTANPAVVHVVDLDGDGRAELVLVPLSAPSQVYRSTIAGVWSLVGPVGGSGGHLLLVDVDGNGTTELLVGSTGEVFTYTPAGLSPAPSIGVPPFTLAAALDFDRDGRTDVVLAANGPPMRIEAWRNPGAGVFQQVPLPLATGFELVLPCRALVAADFDDDTFPDLGALTDQVLAWHNTQQGVAPFGEPCSVPGFGTPDLSVQGSVAPGQSAVLQLANAVPQGLTLLWLGNSKTTWNGLPLLPLDLGIVGAPGCTLLAEPLAIVGASANIAGLASLPFTVPAFPPAAEATVFVQGAVLAPTANPFGALFSRGLALKIQ